MYNSISVVVPVYNSEKSIGELYHRLKKVLAAISEEYEIVMVDDGSEDNSVIAMHKLDAENKVLKVICLDGNYGQQNAIMCGIRHTRGNYVITIDDDLQHPPEEIPKLLTELDKGFDVVYGIPAVKKVYGIRGLGTVLTDMFFTFVCSKPKAVKVGSFRALKRHIAEKISGDYTEFVYITAITLKHTRNIGNVTVEHYNRKYGSSNYGFFRLICLFSRLLIYYSGLSLKTSRGKSPQYIIKSIGL